MSEYRSRRELLRDMSLAAGLTALGGVWSEADAAPRPSRSANEKLNVAHIGAGGKGAEDITQVSADPNVNIVALCDPDAVRAAAMFARHEDAKKYTDFRKMLDEMDKSIDAVVVSAPDHLHFPAAALAMKKGKHVYCQKPLTHSVWEARELTKLSEKNPRLATQMGTQGHAFEGYHRLVEIIRGGVIGPVREVHVWTDRPSGWWKQGINRPTDTPPIPSTLDWDKWLGPAPERPYNPAYVPFAWRGFWDFGTGAIGDMACHLMDPVFWALELKYATAVEAEGEGGTLESPPTSSTIRYEFAAHGAMPAVKVFWYDGVRRPAKELFGSDEVPKIDNGSLFIGDAGKLLINHGDMPILLPKAKYAEVKLPDPSIPCSPGHYKQWLDACRNGGLTGSNFRYAGPMTETILLGNVSLRVGKRIEYDAKKMRVKNAPEAAQYLKRVYRKGWEV